MTCGGCHDPNAIHFAEFLRLGYTWLLICLFLFFNFFWCAGVRLKKEYDKSFDFDHHHNTQKCEKKPGCFSNHLFMRFFFNRKIAAKYC